ncbi:metallophosphoesterase family protein [Microbacterium xanthum]|uniref:metallophosphoesterase family protein n=1 Tax=Microbacterium xanthum TaxID=3079794 RepID=UPI002AD23946|nr:metallophosphoesterase family protein [Microbacterium sp. KSW-48]MDZ8170715.1 metallophosphoesterase family protein [Microbacterium sp. KSW-48]
MGVESTWMRRGVALSVATALGITGAIAGTTAASAAPSGAVSALPLVAVQSALHATGTTTGQVAQLLSPELDERIGAYGRHALPGTGTPILSPDEQTATLERLTRAGAVPGELCDDDLADCEARPTWSTTSGALETGDASARTTATPTSLRAESSVTDVTVHLDDLLEGLTDITGIDQAASVGLASADATTAGAPVLTLDDVDLLGDTVDLMTEMPQTTRVAAFEQTDPALVLGSLVGAEDGVAYAGYVTDALLAGEVTVTAERPAVVDGAGAALRLTVEIHWDVDIDSVIGTIDASIDGTLLVADLGAYVLDADASPAALLQTVSTAIDVQHLEVPASGEITGGAFAELFNAELENTDIGGDDRIAWAEFGTPDTDPGENGVFVEEDEPREGLSFTRMQVSHVLADTGATATISGDDLAIGAELVAEDDIASAVFGLDDIVTLDAITANATAPRSFDAATGTSLDLENLRVLGDAVALPGDGSPAVVTVDTEVTDMDAAVAALFGEEIFAQAPGLKGNLTGSATTTVTATVTPVETVTGGTAAARLEVVLSAESEFSATASGQATMYLESMDFTAAGEFARLEVGAVSAGRDGSLIEPVVPEEPGEAPDTTWAIPTEAPSRILLSLTETPATSIGVTWRTDAAIDAGSVEVRELGGDTRSVPATTGEPVGFSSWEYSSRSHSAVIDGLSPETTYEYRVGTGEHVSDWFSFTTAAESGAFTFIGFGDAQNDLTEGFTPVAQMAFADVPEAAFALHPGDLINNSDRDVQWAEWFRAQEPFTATIPTITTPGNHEYSGDQPLTQYHEHVTQPLNGPVATAEDAYTRAFEEEIAEHLAESAFYVDHQGARIISLDDNPGSGVTEFIPDEVPACELERCESAIEIFLRMQGEWLGDVLAENPHPWSIVTFHQPVFSTSEGRDNALVRNAWLPILEEHDVDLVLTGHDHSYGRGHLIANETDLDGVQTGPVYAVSVSGPKMYTLSDPDDNIWTQNGARQVTRAGNTQGYQVIDVTEQAIHYRAIVAVKQDGSTVDAEVGEVFDEFTITKYPDGTKWVTEAGVEIPADTGDGGSGDGGTGDGGSGETAATLTLSSGTVAAGGTLSLTGSGFEPGAELRVELHSTPQVLGAVTADAAGAFASTVTIPASTETGTHTVRVFAGDDELASAEIEVTAAGALAATGGTFWALGLFLAVALVSVGLLLRRRRTSTS